VSASSSSGAFFLLLVLAPPPLLLLVPFVGVGCEDSRVGKEDVGVGACDDVWVEPGVEDVGSC
jgi:hypothetical protein